MAIKAQEVNLLFERAGVFMLRKRLSDGSISKDPADTYVSNKPIVKSITSSTGKESYDIETGNSIYPADTRATKVNGTLAVVMNSFDRQLFRFATGMKYEENTENATITIIGEIYTVDNEAGTIKLPYKVAENSEIIVKDYATNMPITVTEETATESTFTFDNTTSTLTFADANKGKRVTVTYDAMCTATSTDYLSATPVDNSYELRIYSDIANLKGPLGRQKGCVICDSVKFDGDVSEPPRQLQAGDFTINLKIVEATGDKVLRYIYVNDDDLIKNEA